MANLRNNVKKLCALQGITQKQVAAKLGITDSSLNITLGREHPKFSSVQKIANALGVTIDVLTSENIEDRLNEEKQQDRASHDCKQGLFCPHCGKPLTLYIKAESFDTTETPKQNEYGQDSISTGGEM